MKLELGILDRLDVIREEPKYKSCSSGFVRIGTLISGRLRIGRV